MDEKNRRKIWDGAKITLIFIIVLFSIYDILKSYVVGKWFLHGILVLSALVLIFFAGIVYRTWKMDRDMPIEEKERTE
jgi:hypothetical protein